MNNLRQHFINLRHFFSETIKSRTYLTVYIAGFPEYFEFDSTASGYHMCLRWEKNTGRIDLAVNGELVVGRNTCKYQDSSMYDIVLLYDNNETSDVHMYLPDIMSVTF